MPMNESEVADILTTNAETAKEAETGGAAWECVLLTNPRNAGKGAENERCRSKAGQPSLLFGMDHVAASPSIINPRLEKVSGSNDRRDVTSEVTG